MAGATWNSCCLGVFCIHDATIHHVTSCKATYVRCTCVSCNLPPALLAEWPGSFMCCCGNTGEWNRYENRSQHRKLTLEKKILPPCRPTAVLAGVSLHGTTASLKREKNCSTCSADCGPVWHRQSSVCASPRSKHMKGSKERLFTRKTLIYYDIFYYLLCQP